MPALARRAEFDRDGAAAWAIIAGARRDHDRQMDQVHNAKSHAFPDQGHARLELGQGLVCLVMTEVVPGNSHWRPGFFRATPEAA